MPDQENNHLIIEPVLRESAYEADAKYHEKGVVKIAPPERQDLIGKTVYFKKWHAAFYEEEQPPFVVVPLDKISASK
jgi:hypothetical protein